MSQVIHGEDCVIEMLVDGVYYPILCSTDITFRIQQEVLLKTGPNSGLFREKTTRLSEAFATVSGLSPIGNTEVLSAFYLAQEAIRTEPQQLRITFANTDGEEQQISGLALITGNEFSANVDDWMNATVSFEFSGEVEIDLVPSPTPESEEIFSDTWVTVEGQLYIDGLSDNENYSLIGSNRVILEVDRDGFQYDIITSGSPGNRQCIYNSTTGRITFANGFNAGETVFVLFKIVS